MNKQKVFYILLLVSLTGMVLLSVGILRKSESSREKPKEKENVLELSTNTIQPKENGENALFELGREIWVDIGGAVLKPGVYALEIKGELQPRMFELVKKAGGFRNDVNQAYVAKSFNLAGTLTDGQKVYIPFDWEDEKMLNGNQTRGDSAKSTGGEQKISINTASSTQLQTLKGVGEARAQAIIEGRPYASLEMLVQEKIVPQSILDDNHDVLSI